MSAVGFSQDNVTPNKSFCTKTSRADRQDPPPQILTLDAKGEAAANRKERSDLISSSSGCWSVSTATDVVWSMNALPEGFWSKLRLKPGHAAPKLSSRSARNRHAPLQSSFDLQVDQDEAEQGACDTPIVVCFFCS